MSACDPRTIEALLEHTGFVRNLARGALGRDDLSEDVAQDAWVAALENGPRDPGAARGWFYRVVTNRVVGLRRREALRRRHLRESRPVPVVPSPDEILAREQTRRRLVEALLSLDAAYREPLVLKYYEDLPPREIARRLGLPVETVRTRLRRGIQRLRASLDRRPGGRQAWVLAVIPLTRLPKAKAASAAVPGVAVFAAAAAVVGVCVTVGVLGSSGAPGTAEPPAPTIAGGSAVSTGGATLEGRAGPGIPELLATSPPPARAWSTITVLDDAGSPVEGAQVEVSQIRQDFTFDRDAALGRTDAEGRFRIPRTARPSPAEEVPAPSFVLRVRSPESREDLQDVAVEDWRPDDVTVTLARGYVVAGEVCNRAGRPVPGATVHLEAHGRVFFATSDDAGRFRAKGLPPERWNASVSVCGVDGPLPRRDWTLDSGTQGARLEVPVEGSLKVRLPRPVSRRPSSRVPPLRVTEWAPGDRQEVRSVEFPVPEDGVLWLYGLRGSARYTLWWGPGPGKQCAYEPSVSLASGAVDLRLRPGKDLVLEVVRPPGWSGWPTLQASAPGIVVFGTWTPNGDCVFAGLPDVEFLVTAEGRDQDRREVAGEIRVRPPAAATLLLRLR